MIYLDTGRDEDHLSGAVTIHTMGDPSCLAKITYLCSLSAGHDFVRRCLHDTPLSIKLDCAQGEPNKLSNMRRTEHTSSPSGV